MVRFVYQFNNLLILWSCCLNGDRNDPDTWVYRLLGCSTMLSCCEAPMRHSKSVRNCDIPLHRFPFSPGFNGGGLA